MNVYYEVIGRRASGETETRRYGSRDYALSRLETEKEDPSVVDIKIIKVTVTTERQINRKCTWVEVVGEE